MTDDKFRPPPPPTKVDPASVRIIEPGRRSVHNYSKSGIKESAKPVSNPTSDDYSIKREDKKSILKGVGDLFEASQNSLSSENPVLESKTPEELTERNYLPKKSQDIENPELLTSDSQYLDPEIIAPEQAYILSSSAEGLQQLKTTDLSALPITSSLSLWQYHSLPSENEIPDPHPEYESCLIHGVHNLKIVAARVRGKKHKHEGTHCDDWFEIATCGDWNLIVVSDGAGSKSFSRVGARVSCEAAIQSLKNDLNGFYLTPKIFDSEIFSRNSETYEFLQVDFKIVENAVKNAVNKAYQAVKDAVQNRLGSDKHIQCLHGREIEIKDLYATLLIVVHTCVKDVEGNYYDLAMSVAIGDGMIGSISREGKATLMMKPDSGQFSGETEFLNANMLESRFLNRRINLLPARPQRGFMVMTDGVADDYFPNDLGLARLFCDLVLNRIVDFPSDQNLSTNIEDEILKSAHQLPKLAFSVEGERQTETGRQRLELRSVERYAQQLGVPLEKVLFDCNLLLAGCRDNALPGSDSAERLLNWLDAYQVRGSFDDRTLVIAYREKLP